MNEFLLHGKHVNNKPLYLYIVLLQNAWKILINVKVKEYGL